MITKRGDIYPVEWTVNTDLTGCFTRILARRLGGDATITLPGTVTDPEGGVITHTLTGELPAATYLVEVEVTLPNGEIVTFPTAQDGTRQYDILEVVEDLG